MREGDSQVQTQHELSCGRQNQEISGCVFGGLFVFHLLQLRKECLARLVWKPIFRKERIVLVLFSSTSQAGVWE